ncbi:MAG: hypothetical protein COA86_02775 [Kangiella sp.]|nr:MAG: hypothetical protein COA86_02775 [Kangiella sp.]
MSFKLHSNLTSVLLKIKNYPKVLEPRIDNAAKEFIHRVNRDAKLNAPEAETTLKNSIKVKRLGLIDYESKPEVNYANAIEEGSKKGGWPTFQSMLDWLKVRNIKPHTKGFDLFDLAYAIRKKIYKNGTKAQPFMKPALKKNRKGLDAIVRRHLAGI